MAETAPKIFRLSDILTKEVSLVDRAANQRTFLLRKRNEGRPLESDGKGGFRPTAKSADASPPQGDTPAPAQAPVQPPAPEQPAPEQPPAPGPVEPPLPPGTGPVDQPPAPAPGKDQPKEGEPEAPAPGSDDQVPQPSGELSKATYESLVGTIERLTGIAAKARTREAQQDSPELVAEVMTALGTLRLEGETEVPGWANGVWKCSRGTLQKAVSTASEKLREIAEQLAIDTADEPPPHELRWRITDVLDGLVELTRFEAAEAAMAKNAGGEAAAFRALVEGLEKALGAHLSDTPRPPSETVDAAHAARLVNAAEGVLKMMQSRMREQARRIRELEEEPSLSHRIPVESTKHEAPGKPVAWPMDMNQRRYPDEDDLNFG